QRLPVVLPGRERLGCGALRSDLAEKPAEPRLVATLASLPGLVQRPLRELGRIARAADPEVGLGQRERRDRLEPVTLPASQRLLDDGNRVAGPPRERVGGAKVPRDHIDQRRELPLPA